MCAIIKIWSSFAKEKLVDATTCISRRTLAGQIAPPSGMIYDQARLGDLSATAAMAGRAQVP